MKITVALLLSFLFFGGISQASGAKLESALGDAAPMMSKLPDLAEIKIPKNYQGPYEIDLGTPVRKPAKAYLPLQYESQNSWPLVVLLHGFSGTGEAQDIYLGLRFRASLRGFILLTPEGTVTPQGTFGVDGKELSGNQFWNATDTCCDFAKTGVDDAGYLLSLIEKTKQTYKVDSSRVYIIGHSNGGFMANRLGCEAGSSFAGIANLAGGTYKDPKNCRSPAPVPYLQIHAEDDATVLYQGGPEYAGGKETVGQWLEKNGCQTKSINGPTHDLVFPIPGPDTNTTTWNSCSSGKEVEFWTIKSHQSDWHNPHIPIFNLRFTDAVLDFLMR